jgi:hypothetical protein
MAIDIVKIDPIVVLYEGRRRLAVNPTGDQLQHEIGCEKYE